MKELNFNIFYNGSDCQHIHFDNNILGTSNNIIYVYHPENRARSIYFVPQNFYQYATLLPVSDAPPLLFELYLKRYNCENWKLTWEDIPEGVLT